MGGFGIWIDGNLKICKFKNGLKGVIKNEGLRIKTWHMHKGIGTQRQYLAYLTTRDEKEFYSAHRASLSIGAPSFRPQAYGEDLAGTQCAMRTCLTLHVPTLNLWQTAYGQGRVPHHAHTPRTRRAPRYVHGLAGRPQGVRVPDSGKH